MYKKSMTLTQALLLECNEMRINVSLDDESDSIELIEVEPIVENLVKGCTKPCLYATSHNGDNDFTFDELTRKASLGLVKVWHEFEATSFNEKTMTLTQALLLDFHEMRINVSLDDESYSVELVEVEPIAENLAKGCIEPCLHADSHNGDNDYTFDELTRKANLGLVKIWHELEATSFISVS